MTKKIQNPKKGHTGHCNYITCYLWLADVDYWNRSHNSTQHVEVKRRGTTLSQSACRVFINMPYPALVSNLPQVLGILFKYNFSIRDFALGKRSAHANIKHIWKEYGWLEWSRTFFLTQIHAPIFRAWLALFHCQFPYNLRENCREPLESLESPLVKWARENKRSVNYMQNKSIVFTSGHDSQARLKLQA